MIHTRTTRGGCRTIWANQSDWHPHMCNRTAAHRGRCKCRCGTRRQEVTR
jgi:hypothetical protein